MVDERPPNEEPEDDLAVVQEQAHLAYIKRWVDRGRRGAPMTREQVTQCFADYTFAGVSGRIAINTLLERD